MLMTEATIGTEPRKGLHVITNVCTSWAVNQKMLLILSSVGELQTAHTISSLGRQSVPKLPVSMRTAWLPLNKLPNPKTLSCRKVECILVIRLYTSIKN